MDRYESYGWLRSGFPQVMGPHEISVNTKELLGRAKAEARLLEAHGWQPVHVVIGANKSVNKLLQRIAQDFGDPQMSTSGSRRGPQNGQVNQQGGRGGQQQAPVGDSKGSKSREGWVQWSQPKKAPEREREAEVRSVSEGERSQSRLPWEEQDSSGQQQRNPSASSPIRSQSPYAGHTHSLRASLAASAHQ